MSVLQMQMSTIYVNERRLEATDHLTRRAETPGVSSSSEQKRGERSRCDLAVQDGQRLLQMAVLGRLQHELTVVPDDQLLVLGGPSASGAGRAVWDAVWTHRERCKCVSVKAMISPPARAGPRLWFIQRSIPGIIICGNIVAGKQTIGKQRKKSTAKSTERTQTHPGTNNQSV